MPLFGAIEAGGTKFVCAVGTGPHDLKETRFPTTTPEETIGRAIDFFKAQGEPLAAVGKLAPSVVIPVSGGGPSHGAKTRTSTPR